jgi:hypothetical protein
MKQDIGATKRKNIEDDKERKKLRRDVDYLLRENLTCKKIEHARSAEKAEINVFKSRRKIVVLKVQKNCTKDIKQRVVNFLNEKLEENRIKLDDIDSVNVFGKDNLLKVGISKMSNYLFFLLRLFE